MSQNPTPAVPNFLTFDIEEWYMGNYAGLDTSAFAGSPSRLEWEVDRLIGICSQRGIRATCFVVGRLAEEKPALVRRLHDAGHEIASHSYRHDLVHPMSPSSFREDLRRSIDVLQGITGNPILGFRAPSWSVRTPTLPWFYSALAEESIRYSSAVNSSRHSVSLFSTRSVCTGPIRLPLPSITFTRTKLGTIVSLNAA